MDPARSLDESLFDLIRKGDVILFAGSGCSIYAGYPSSTQIIDMIKNLVEITYQQYLDKGSLLEVAEEFEKIKGREKGRNELIELLNSKFNKMPPYEPQYHRMLVEIPQIKTIITTNYDPLFESAFGDKGRIILTKFDFSNPTEKNVRVNIYKIHGTIDRPDTIILTTSDYIGFLRREKEDDLYIDQLKLLLSQHVVLFIGYSLDDYNIEFLLKNLSDQLENHKKQWFLVSPNIPKHVVRDLQYRYKIHYIDSTFESFIFNLKNYIDTHLFADMQKGLVSKNDFQEILARREIFSIISADSYGNVQVNVGPATKNKHLNVNFIFDHDNQEKKEHYLDLTKGNRFDPLVMSSETGLKNFSLRIDGAGVLSDLDGITELGVWVGEDLSGECILLSNPSNNSLRGFEFKYFESPSLQQFIASNDMLEICLKKPRIDDGDDLILTINQSQIIMENYALFRFLYGWINGETIYVLTEKSPNPILEIPSPGQEMDLMLETNISETYQKYQQIIDIQRIFDVNLPLLNDISDADLQTIDELSMIINVNHDRDTIELTIKGPRSVQERNKLIEKIPTDPQNCEFNTTHNFSLFGNEISIRFKVHIEQALFLNREDIIKQIVNEDKIIKMNIKSVSDNIYYTDVIQED